jgi:hypothetical protein
MGPKKTEIPVCRNLNGIEAQYIKSMFSMYDYRGTGSVPRHLIVKLLTAIGIDQIFGLPSQLTLKDTLLFIDAKIPDRDQVLDSALFSFTRIVGDTLPDGVSKVVKPDKLVAFLANLDRNIPSLDEANMLLTSMLEYDDCSEETAVSSAVLSRELNAFAKKNNARNAFSR